MELIRQSIKRPVTVLMAVCCVLVFGFVSFFNTPFTLIPDMNLPMVLIYTSYSNAGPTEVESLVTDPLEDTLSTLSGIQNVNSISREGASLIVLSYSFGTDMNEASAQIRDRLELVGAMLPDEAATPMLIRMNMDEVPVSVLSVTSSDPSAAYTIVQDTIVPQLEKLDGVASVSVSGGADNSIAVVLDEQAAAQYGLSMSSLTAAISGANVNLPAGYLDQGSKKLFLRSQNKLTSAKEVAELPVALPGGGVVRLGDVAQVSEAPVEATSLSRINGQSSITISVSKQQDANTLRVCSDVAKTVKTLQSKGYNLTLGVVSDQGQFIGDSLVNVAESLLVGAALAILVLWFFLGDWKASAIISISIPTSVIITFVMMFFANISVNLVSMGGLVVGVGMMVDNSIVVLESMFRCRSEGMDYIPAAETGAKLVAGAVLASTMTTVVVFLPIVFMKGLSSELMSQAGLTIAFALLASLISALTLVPCLFVRLRPDLNEKHIPADGMMRWLIGLYNRSVKGALRHPGRVILAAFAALAVSLSLIPFIGTELITSVDQGQFNITIETEQGLSLDALDGYLRRAEDVASKIPDVEKYSASASTGTNSGLNMTAVGGGTSGSSATVAVYLKSGHKIKTAEAAQQARDALGQLPGCKITVAESNSMMLGASTNNVVMYVQSKDDEVLAKAVEDMKTRMLSVRGIVAVTSDLAAGRPEARIVVDKLKASSYGLTPAYITTMVSQKVQGVTAAKISRGGEELKVKVQYPDGRYQTVSDLRSMSIATPTGKSVPLVEVASIQIDAGPVSVTHADGQKVATVTGQVVGRDYGSVNRDVQAALAGEQLPEGSSIYNNDNSVASMSKEFRSLGLALVLAIGLVFVVMACQFESLRVPLVIMAAVPLAAIGALVGLFVTGSTINMISLIGMIVLVGIVVNNAIVLLDCVAQLRAEGVPLDDALVQAGQIRLRPILMTTLTTVLGELPLSLGIGSGGQMMQSMAIVIMAGLMVSTILTLVVVPSLYKRSELRLQRRAEKRARRQQPPAVPPEDVGLSAE